MDLRLNPEIQFSVHRLRQAFEAASPFPHLVMDHLFDAGLVSDLVSSFPRFEDDNARNELGLVGKKAVVAGVGGISDAYRELDEIVASDEWLKLLGLMTGIPNLLYDPEYIGGGTHENLSGQELDYHVDFNYHPSRKWHRRLNLILFLNPIWNEGWGGNLQLHHDAWLDAGQPDVQVIPKLGTCAIFETSEKSWHGFERINLPEGCGVDSRKSIALYFYTEERPEEEVRPEHGTFYVGRPLSRRLDVGHTLSEEDVTEIRSRLQMRDEWIEFLYKRELEWSAEMGRIRELSATRVERADQYELNVDPNRGATLKGPHEEVLPVREPRAVPGLLGALDTFRELSNGDALVAGWALDAEHTEAPRGIAVFSADNWSPVPAVYELVARPFVGKGAEALGLARYWKVGLRVTFQGGVAEVSETGIYVFAVFREFAYLLPHAEGVPETLRGPLPLSGTV